MDNVAVSRPTGQRQRKNKRGFDWSAAVFGKYLLKIAYVGTNYLVSVTLEKLSRGFSFKCNVGISMAAFGYH